MTEALPPYTLIRSDRKTLALAIDVAGALIVRAPKRMAKRDIERFIRAHDKWIRDKQAARRKAACERPPFVVRDGAELPFRGGMARLAVEGAEQSTDSAAAPVLVLPAENATVAFVQKWLDAQARAVLLPRAEYLARSVDLALSAVRLSHAKARWGSMSAKRSLNLNAALMLCPDEVADYVIWHELAHITHMNHSPAFWARVERYCPDYRRHRAWLHEHGDLLRALG